MILSKHCQECVHANTIGDCEGKTQAELDHIPCGRWEFDMALLDEPEEFTAEQAIKNVVKHQALDLTIEEEFDQQSDCQELGYKGCSACINESPANKFKRISTNRLKRALYDLKLLAQFGRLHKQYKWTQQQADDIVAALQKAIDKIKKELQK